MVDLPTGFPFKSSTRVIKDLLPQIARDRGGPDLDVVMQMGQNELQNRVTSCVARIALGVALITLLVTGAAAWYARVAFQSSERWEQNQLAALERLQKDGAAMRQALEKFEAKLEAPRPAKEAKKVPRAGAAAR
jgi:hypothetical protein